MLDHQLYFTFSSVDMHWPELHALFGTIFILLIGFSLNAWKILSSFEWHWYRFEYQARGGIHGHRVAKLENDPGLCTLFEKALKGYLAEMPVNNADPADLLSCDGIKASEIVC
ncbi:unnamed protein product [Pocillopora meandrina]|uniref:Uncharacterized protein n=1 Tax=Pocillopora meandrina TaxID=46732 RepID=A0AAU9W1V0_9CNID|nr:unnamed protein product [Pocillopora meandrina]